MEKNVKIETIWEYDSVKEYGGLGKHIKKGDIYWVTPERAIILVKKDLAKVLMIRRKKNG